MPIPRSAPRRSLALPLLATLALCSGAACALRSADSYPVHAPARPAGDAPVRFLVETAGAGSPLAEPARDGSCRNPVVDPRDGTRLRLLRSEQGVGDYEVPDGRYGVRSSELLRVECATGRVVGIVPRRA